MRRVAFRMTIREGTDEEYVRRHADVWPQVLADLTGAGVRNYSIFKDGPDLFAFFEVDDFEAFVAASEASEPIRRWDAEMDELVAADLDPATGWFVEMEEVFRLD